MKRKYLLPVLAGILLLPACSYPTTTVAKRITPTASPSPTPTASPLLATDEAVLEVSGPTRAMITYTTTNGNTSQESGARLPWRITIPNPKGPLGIVVVLAQSSSGEDVEIKCNITMDGKQHPNTSKGAFAVVTCSTSG